MTKCTNVVARKVLAVIASLALAAMLVPATALSAMAAEPASQGKLTAQASFPDDFPQSDVCGTCIWTIDKEGLLKIAPKTGTTGTLANFDGDVWSVPWWQFRAYITSIVIDEGVVAGSSIDHMFDGMASVRSIDLENLDTTNVTSMNSLFADCAKLDSIIFADFNTAKVTSMESMFQNCKALAASPDFSKFDTQAVKSAESMFEGCSNLRDLDLTSFNTRSMTNMSDMFKGCSKLGYVRLGSTFSFSGAGANRLCELPKPYGSVSGKWMNESTKVLYLPAAIPNNVSGNYTADINPIKFVDVNSNTPHYKDIEWMADNQISTGWDEKGKYYFKGNLQILRQDMAAFMHRLGNLAGVGENGTATLKFSDVNANTPHYKDILWLASTQISTGWNVNGRNYFRGNTDILRQDMAAFMHRLADLADDGKINGSTKNGSVKISFEDVNASTPHQKDILWMASNGITEGWLVDGKRYFRGTEKVKRQDTAAFMHRLWDVLNANPEE